MRYLLLLALLALYAGPVAASSAQGTKHGRARIVVRSTSPPPAIPEPSAALLFGLAALGLIRRAEACQLQDRANAASARDR